MSVVHNLSVMKGKVREGTRPPYQADRPKLNPKPKRKLYAK